MDKAGQSDLTVTHNMDTYFKEKIVLVTGAAGGIGRTTTKKLFNLGAIVHVLDINEEGLNSLVSGCPSVIAHVVSLADWEATKKVVEDIGHIDMVVNNAGVVPQPTPFLDIEKATFDHVLSINLMAPINIAQVAGRVMKASGKPGAIVNVSSVCGFLGSKGLVPYSVSKAGLNMVTKCMASEFAPEIRVNGVNPSTTLTDLSITFMDQLKQNQKGAAFIENWKSRHPLARFG